MKKFITAVLVASVLSTPVMARDYNHRAERHHDNGSWIAPLIGGVLIGAIVASSGRDDQSDDHERRERYEDRYYRERYYERAPRVVCWEEERVDYYGYIRTYRVCR